MSLVASGVIAGAATPAAAQDCSSNGIVNIAQGQTLTYGITLFGSGTVTNEDFVTEFSIVQVEGYRDALTAAKFEEGPNLESGYGAAIPEPVSLMLLALGGLLFVRRGR